MAFSDYKDLLPTTRVVSMSDLGKVSSRPRSTQNTVPNMSMDQRIDEYMGQVSILKAQAHLHHPHPMCHRS